MLEAEAIFDLNEEVESRESQGFKIKGITIIHMVELFKNLKPLPKMGYKCGGVEPIPKPPS